MFKWVLIAVIMICPACLGFALSAQLNRRVALISELLEVLEKLKTYIGFWLLPMPRIFLKLAEKENLTKDFFGRCEKKLKTGGNTLEKVWQEECKTLFSGLYGNEYEIFLLLGSSLGKSDAKMQVEAVERAKLMLSKELDLAKAQKDQYQSLFKSLGVIIGILAGILLI